MKILSRTWCMLFILVYSQGKYICQAGCLTWDLYFGKLTLICRTHTDGSPVVIFDNNGAKITNCSLEGEDGHCQLFQEDQSLAVNISTTELNVTIQRSHITDYNGQWTCKHKTAVFSTNVSSLTGTIYETAVELEIVTTTKEHVELKCSSCKIPFGFNAEFLINNKSIDSVTYDPWSSTCYHGSGVCNPRICGCSSPGNQFTRKLRAVDMSMPILFSCDMIFVDTYTTAKFSKTSGIYLNAKGFHPMEIITRIIKPGKPIDDSTGKITNLDLTTVSLNKYSTTKSTSTEHRVPVALIVGLSILGVITACLLLVLVCQYLHVRKLKTRKHLIFSNTDENYQLLERKKRSIEMEEMSMHIEHIPMESQKIWMLAGFFFQIAQKELIIHLNNKMTIFYEKLKNEYSIHKQDFSKFLKGLPGKSLNYQAVNENFKKFDRDETKYDYKIRDAETLTKVLLPCSVIDIGQFNEDFSLGFGDLLDLFNTVDTEMPDTVKSEVLKIQRDCTDWFSNETNVWTDEKLSAHIESVQLITKYTGKTEEIDQKILQLQGDNIFNDPGLEDFIGESGQELVLFIKQTGKNHVCCNLMRMNALLRDNNVYNEFLKKKRSEEISIYQFAKLIMEIGMTVVKNYITLHVFPPANKDFKSFLNHNKHKLFHAWHNKRRCCQCNSKFIQNATCDLTREQFALLFCRKDGNNEQPTHQGNTDYCICSIIANRDVTLDAIDFTIALCIMMHCSSTKAPISEKEKIITPSIVEETKSIRSCRNTIFPMVTSSEMPQDIYNAAWKQAEKCIIAMSACVNADFHDQIKNDIQSLQSDDLQGGQRVELAEMLEQCEQDIKLSRNQQHETSFLSKLNTLESGTVRHENNSKDRLKDLEWQAVKRNVILKIKRYQIIADGNLPFHEVLIDVNTQNKWDIDEILETIRNKASSICQGGSVQIIETTLEAFSLIVEIDGNIFNEEIEQFFWNLLESCHIDFGCNTVINISMKLLKSKLTSVSKFRSQSIIPPITMYSGSEIAQIRKRDVIKLKTGKDAYFTSSGEWSNEEFIFVERNNNSLIFYNFKTKKERIIRLPERPFGMAVIGEEKVAMSFPEKQEIRISRVKNEKIIDLDFQNVGGKCYTLTKKDAETVLVSIEDDGIWSYNIKNRQLKDLGIQIQNFVPWADELFCRAERLLHTSRENRSLYCYDFNGVLQWKISDVLQNPTAITSDAFGNVFATDFVSSKLYHISPDGQSYNVLLSKVDKLLHPSALHFCEKRNWLIIVNRDNGFVFFYEVLYN